MNNDFSINLANREEFVYGANDVIQCWDIILKTIPGSIPFMPTFGSNLFQYIDRPINFVFGEMANTIIKDLEFWEKRAIINKVDKEITKDQVKLFLYGIYTSTGESIVSKLNLTEIFGEIQTELFLLSDEGQIITSDDDINIII